MKYNLSQRSLVKLRDVHSDLVAVVKLAITLTDIDFTVLEGLRSVERQKQLVRTGKSKTMNSRHLTGHAVDLGAWVNGGVSWEWEHYNKIAEAMKHAANNLGIDLEWGGDWKTFKDGPHFQLSRKRYPHNEFANRRCNG